MVFLLGQWVVLRLQWDHVCKSTDKRVSEMHTCKSPIKQLAMSFHLCTGSPPLAMWTFSFSFSCVWLKETPLPVICEGWVSPLVTDRSQQVLPPRGGWRGAGGGSRGTQWPQPSWVCGFVPESDPFSSGSFRAWEGSVVFGKWKQPNSSSNDHEGLYFERLWGTSVSVGRWAGLGEGPCSQMLGPWATLSNPSGLFWGDGQETKTLATSGHFCGVYV